jgi:antitoxin ParD1/3/4
MNMNVSLTEELANFVKAKVSAGRYASSSEVVREALRLMEKAERQEAEKLGLLRQAWRKGVESGDAAALDFAAPKQEARARLAAERAKLNPALEQALAEEGLRADAASRPCRSNGSATATRTVKRRGKVKRASRRFVGGWRNVASLMEP